MWKLTWKLPNSVKYLSNMVKLFTLSLHYVIFWLKIGNLCLICNLEKVICAEIFWFKKLARGSFITFLMSDRRLLEKGDGLLPMPILSYISRVLLIFFLVQVLKMSLVILLGSLLAAVSALYLPLFHFTLAVILGAPVLGYSSCTCTRTFTTLVSMGWHLL